MVVMAIYCKNRLFKQKDIEILREQILPISIFPSADYQGLTCSKLTSDKLIEER